MVAVEIAIVCAKRWLVERIFPDMLTVNVSWSISCVIESLRIHKESTTVRREVCSSPNLDSVGRPKIMHRVMLELLPVDA